MTRFAPALAGDANVAPTAALLADPARVAMLWALSDGRACSAGELARSAGIGASTASEHLARLVAARLLEGQSQGRHRYYRLANPAVIQVLESLAGLAPAAPVTVAASTTPLRFARTCYDHLAGALGVRVTETLVARGALQPAQRDFQIGARGEEYLTALGVDVASVTEAARRSRRVFARSCLDWSERRSHLAGALGAALATALLEWQWLERMPRTRAVRVTRAGRVGLRRVLDLTVDVTLR